MLQQYVWWAVGGLSFFFFILFYRIRHNEGGKSTLLKMKEDLHKDTSHPIAEKSAQTSSSSHDFQNTSRKYRPKSQSTNYAFANESAQGPSAERSLNVMFMYNAMAWDAYEVLGIPAGSSFQTAQEVHAKLTKNIDPEAKKFYDVAFESIARQTRSSYSSDSGEGESAS
jgi:hypothetical protein